MNKQHILLIFGGQSSEHEVSLISAKGIHEAMSTEKYQVSLIKITHDGKWLFCNTVSSADVGSEVQVDISAQTFMLADGTAIKPDVVLPVLHGKNGEDGTIQGLLTMMKLPFVGPSTMGAALTMDKDLTKRVLRDASIPVSEWVVWHISDEAPSYQALLDKLGDVMFVKPANAGSSYGVSKVRTADEYDKALTEAAQYDSIVLIEQAISGFEVQVSVLGNKSPEISQICEIESVEDFHDFEDKYSEESSVKFHIPARLPREQTKRILDYTATAYRLTRGQGMARIDFFVTDDDAEYLNEINSIPGFTGVSVYPMLWREQGLEYFQLIDKLIELAVE